MIRELRLASARRTARVLLLAPIPAAVQAQREFGAATFTAPAGWEVQAGRTRETFSRIRDQDLCLIAVYAEEQSPPEVERAFADAWKTVFSSGYRRTDRPTPTEATSPTGYRHLVGEGDLEDQQSNRFFARLHLFPVGRRTQTVVWLGNSKRAFDGCRPELEAFFATLRFPRVPTVAAGPAGPAPGQPAPASSGAKAAGVISSGTAETFDNVTFVPPVGWKVLRSDAAVTMSPTDGKPIETVEVSILRGRRFGGSLEREMESAWAEVQAALGAQLMRNVSGRPYDLDEPAQSLRGWDYLRGEGGMIVRNLQHGVWMYVIRAGDRVERVVVISRTFRENVTTADAARKPAYQRAIQQLVFSLKFANQPEKERPPARLAGHPIAGVWTGFVMSFGRLKPHYAIFFGDGTAYLGPIFPLRGLHQIDPSIEQPAARRYWGRYTMTGQTGKLTMIHSSIPLQRSGNVLVLTTNQTDHRFLRMEMPEGSVLDGTWCLSGGGCLTMTRAGQFEDRGAARIMEHAVYPYPETPEGGEGTYQLVDHTLILRYDRGPEIRLAFPGLIEERGSTPRRLIVSFNGDALTR
jgi:hypothetical protein